MFLTSPFANVADAVSWRLCGTIVKLKSPVILMLEGGPKWVGMTGDRGKLSPPQPAAASHMMSVSCRERMAALAVP
jgi:hypothetical protein